MDIRLHILEEITNGFSVDSRIGRGGYGDVYKGVYNGEVIAIKLLHVDTVQGIDDQLFKNEVGNLLRVKHPNIVQLLGYCYETRSKFVKYNGEDVFGKHIYRALCFEYFQGGSLDMHLHAPSLAPNWRTRYNIIKGVCEGLNFLHGCEPPILHLDIKPANILLDSSMESKVADLGLSRLFSRSHSHVTERIVGTQKYMSPEFMKQGIISSKNDVFSLGVVIIEIMTGPTGYSDFSEMGGSTQFMQEVLTNWSTVIEATWKYRSEEIHQVKTCIELAIRCVDSERDNRPTVAQILDTLNNTETHIPKRQLIDVPMYSVFGPKNTLGNTLKTRRDELENIANEHQNCNFNMQQVPDNRETSSSMEEALTIGRTEEKQKILSILSESRTEEMAIFPIYGIGGIGKTTLAQLIFNDTQFQDYSRVWVYVSQKFDLNKIGNSIISQLTNRVSNIAETQMLHNRLGDLFAGKSILIVLDDLWEEKQQELDKLKDMLRPRLGSKVVIVTTRDEAIAKKVSRTVMPYELKILTNDMCWTIIKQKSFFEDRDDKEQLEQIGRDIAVKCGGVALAAQSLGYMLRDITYDQWESVRDSYIWNSCSLEGPSSIKNEVLSSLLLSYSHMNEFLQLCFSYCAVFPKGRNIVKYDLIYQWIALGLIGPSSTFDAMQVCEKYITKLLGMSFLQHSKTPSSDEYQDTYISLFTMHDLVHDLARAILADKVNEVGNDIGSSCHYALLTDCSKPLQLLVNTTETSHFNFFLNLFQKKSSPENLKALHFQDCGKLKLHGHAFSRAEFLLVLDLSECFIQKLPDSIGQLKNLRYLHAPRIQDTRIPNCITKFSELNYLSIRGSPNISALPESIGNMKGLMHLDLSGCNGIMELPVSFAELKQLVHLNLSRCKHMSISEAFGGFTKLQYLNLAAEEYVGTKSTGLAEVIGNLKKLRYLNLSYYMRAMAPSKDQFNSLLGSIFTLSNLEHLDLSKNSRFSSIPEGIGDLKKLHTLDLVGCEYRVKLPDSMVNMVSLKVLNVDRSVKLDENLLSLLNIALLPHFVVHASSHTFSSNIIRLRPTNPIKLVIDGLENVKFAEEAQSIKLIEKQRIKDLGFQWTVSAGRVVDDKVVLEKLVPPGSVRILSITGYKSLSLPDWLTSIVQYLPNLSDLNLCDFPNHINLPPLCQLPNLKQLSLCRMGGLEEWNTGCTCGEEGANKLLFPNLEKLTIEKCVKLRIKPCLPGAIRILYIKDCDNMLESSSLICVSSYSRINELNVECSRVPLYQWRLLHHLSEIFKLVITRCSDLTTSPKIIQNLSSLESLSMVCLGHDHEKLPSWLLELTSLRCLRLSGCSSITSLPQCLGKLASLETVTINNCKGIRSLPDSIRQLTKLDCLVINYCPALKEWCESKENKRKFAHVGYMAIY